MKEKRSRMPGDLVPTYQVSSSGIIRTTGAVNYENYEGASLCLVDSGD